MNFFYTLVDLSRKVAYTLCRYIMGDLTKNFSREEFACRCGCGLDAVSMDLVKSLQNLRNHFELPVHISSGIRCPDHNAAVGGQPDSKHLFGLAADISIYGIYPEDIAMQATRIRDFRLGGIGLYDNFVHLDVRRDGPARWDG